MSADVVVGVLPEHYEDQYGKRVWVTMVDKVKSHEIKAAPKAPERGTKVVDIMAALTKAGPHREGKQAAGAGDR